MPPQYTFEQWVRSVDSSLSASKRGLSSRDLDPEALRVAYSTGVSPVLFAKAPNLPLKTVPIPTPPPTSQTAASPTPLAIPSVTPHTKRRLTYPVAFTILALLASVIYFKFVPRAISPQERASILNFLTDEHAVYGKQKDLDYLMVQMGLKFQPAGPGELNLLASKVDPQQAPDRCKELAQLAFSDIQSESQMATGKLIYNPERDQLRSHLLTDIGMSNAEFEQLCRQSSTDSLMTADFAVEKGLLDNGMAGLANGATAKDTSGYSGPGDAPLQNP